MKKLSVNRVESPDGETHFVLEEFQYSEYPKHSKSFDLTEIKRISRKEAAKPFALFREE